MLLMLLGSLIDDNSVHLKNAQSSILVMPLGIIMLFNPVQELNTPCLIMPTLSESTTAVNPLQPRKALLPIPTTLPGILIDSNPVQP